LRWNGQPAAKNILLSFLARVPPIIVALRKALIPRGAVARGYSELSGDNCRKEDQDHPKQPLLDLSDDLEKLKYMKD
jgi:hypothetical protein